MTGHFNVKNSLTIAAILMFPSVQAATMSKEQFKADKAHIKGEFKNNKANCKALAGNAKDVCVAQSKAKEKVALAELEYAYSGKADDQNKVLVAKAKSAYEVAKQECDDKAGNDKDVCVMEAKATETKALAEAKMGKQIREAKIEATEDKRDADYKVAVEKCDALAGDTKASCITAAKIKFGKN